MSEASGRGLHHLQTKIFLTRNTESVWEKKELSQSINLASERLYDGIHAEAGDLVHRTCRGQYTNQKATEGKLKKKLKLKSPKKRRQPRSEDSKPKCLFCGKEEKDQKRGEGGGGGGGVNDP